MMKSIIRLLIVSSLAGTSFLSANAAEKLKLLLIDGQNNHAWAETSPVMVAVLEESGRFDVTVATSPPSAPRAPRKPKDSKNEEAMKKFNAELKAWMAKAEKIKSENKAKWESWRPKFADYDVVVSNYNGELWPDEVQKAFEAYVSGGGGFVAVHAADNAFPQWKAYNEMIAVGGWGGRSELSGPYLRLRDGKWTNDPTKGRGGSHGSRHEFVVERQNSHPIVDGLPEKWLQAEDELYDRLRGPAKNVTVLASAFADPAKNGSGENEPMLMVVKFGEGRCFHTTLGHNTVAMSSVGFQETLKRGAEWVATGKVTFPAVSADTLTLDKVAVRELKAAAAN